MVAYTNLSLADIQSQVEGLIALTFDGPPNKPIQPGPSPNVPPPNPKPNPKKAVVPMSAFSLFAIHYDIQGGFPTSGPDATDDMDVSGYEAI